MNHEYKNSGRGSQSEREARTANAIELRTQKRDGMLQKKRSTSSMGEEGSIKISVLVEKVNSSDPAEIIEGVTEFRRLLSAAKSPPIEKIVMNGLTPIFAKLTNPENPIYARMADDNAVRIIHEAAWVITNIASGTNSQTMSVIKTGVLDNLVKLLWLNNNQLQDQAVWAIGNIAGDCEKGRDAAINAGILEPFILLIEKEIAREEQNIPFLRNLSWAFGNLNRGRDPPPYIEHTEKCLPVLIKLIGIDDTDIMVDAYWALSYMCDAGIAQADMVIRTGIIKDCIDRLYAYHMLSLKGDTMQMHLKEQILSPIVRAVGNVATYEIEQCDYIINLNAIPILKELFNIPYETKKSTRIKKEICWVISNITAGTPQQVDEVIRHGFLDLLIHTIKTADTQTRTEATWAICNAAMQINEGLEYARELAECGAIGAFSKFLPWVITDAKLVVVILDAIISLLVWAENESVGGENSIANEIENCDLLENIEELQSATAFTVANRAEQIIRKYFDGQ